MGLDNIGVLFENFWDIMLISAVIGLAVTWISVFFWSRRRNLDEITQHPTFFLTKDYLISFYWTACLLFITACFVALAWLLYTGVIESRIKDIYFPFAVVAVIFFVASTVYYLMGVGGDYKNIRQINRQ
jgi:hypothetical protein